jgi:hypothetical protein
MKSALPGVVLSIFIIIISFIVSSLQRRAHNFLPAGTFPLSAVDSDPVTEAGVRPMASVGITRSVPSILTCRTMGILNA